MSRLMTGAAIASLLSIGPAIAQDPNDQKLREQYIYQQSEQLKAEQKGGQAQAQQPIGQVKANSGPGVAGQAGSTNGPAGQPPSGSADASSKSGSANYETSGGPADAPSNTTQPSQDSSGVQGYPDTRTGPSTKQPDKDAGKAAP